MAIVLPDTPEPLLALVAASGFGSALSTFVSEIVAVVDSERKEDATVSWNWPRLKGFSSSTVARPVPSVNTEMERKPFEKTTLGPSVGEENVTDAPDMGVLRPSRTSTTGWTVRFFFRMLIPS